PPTFPSHGARGRTFAPREDAEPSPAWGRLRRALSSLSYTGREEGPTLQEIDIAAPIPGLGAPRRCVLRHPGRVQRRRPSCSASGGACSATVDACSGAARRAAPAAVRAAPPWTRAAPPTVVRRHRRCV